MAKKKTNNNTLQGWTEVMAKKKTNNNTLQGWTDSILGRGGLSAILKNAKVSSGRMFYYKLIVSHFDKDEMLRLENELSSRYKNVKVVEVYYEDGKETETPIA